MVYAWKPQLFKSEFIKSSNTTMDYAIKLDSYLALLEIWKYYVLIADAKMKRDIGCASWISTKVAIKILTLFAFAL
jgi:hypothetical protein